MENAEFVLQLRAGGIFLILALSVIAAITVGKIVLTALNNK